MKDAFIEAVKGPHSAYTTATVWPLKPTDMGQYKIGLRGDQGSAVNISGQKFYFSLGMFSRAEDMTLIRDTEENKILSWSSDEDMYLP